VITTEWLALWISEYSKAGAKILIKTGISPINVNNKALSPYEQVINL